MTVSIRSSELLIPVHPDIQSWSITIRLVKNVDYCVRGKGHSEDLKLQRMSVLCLLYHCNQSWCVDVLLVLLKTRPSSTQLGIYTASDTVTPNI